MRTLKSAALLIIDMISLFDFAGGERLSRQALAIADRIVRLKRRMKHAGCPVIYCNDNFGRWRSNFHHLVESALEAGARGQPVAQRLMPDADDFFVLKPQHSAFFSTPLENLLRSRAIAELVLTGVSTDSCLIATTCDAKMRGYAPLVPRDCTAALTAQHTRQALAVCAAGLKVPTPDSTRLQFLPVSAGDGTGTAGTHAPHVRLSTTRSATMATKEPGSSPSSTGNKKSGSSSAAGATRNTGAAAKRSSSPAAKSSRTASNKS